MKKLLKLTVYALLAILGLLLTGLGALNLTSSLGAILLLVGILFLLAGVVFVSLEVYK